MSAAQLEGYVLAAIQKYFQTPQWYQLEEAAALGAHRTSARTIVAHLTSPTPSLVAAEPAAEGQDDKVPPLLDSEAQLDAMDTGLDAGAAGPSGGAAVAGGAGMGR